MNELIDQFDISAPEDFSIQTYVFGIVICAVLLYLLSIVYIKFGKAISNRSQLSRVLILVGITTFIIISIVKSSLALSLGLVGALSIVRFRTAIKEPEELGYFFISISIGLGMGANQLFPTLIGFFVLILVIVVLSKSSLKNSISQNLIIAMTSQSQEKSKITAEISKILQRSANQVDLKRIKYSDDRINLNFLINVASLDTINEINDNLLRINDGIEITFIDSEV